MGVLSRLIIKLSAETGQMDRELSKASRKVANLGRDMQSAGMAMTAGLTLPLVGVGVAALKAASKMEQAEIAFGTMMGSAAKGKKMLEELAQFALKTPFEFQELQDTSKRLMAMGFAANEVIPTMRTLGNAVSALGGGPELFNRIAINLGQMKSVGRVAAREMRDFAMAGIPAWDLLAKTMGKTVSEVREMVSKRQIEASVFIPAMMEEMNRRFGGLMEKQMRTLGGKWSNLKDRLFFLFREMGEGPLLEAASSATDAMEGMIKTASEWVKAFKALPGPIQKVSIGIVGLTAVAGPAIYVLGGLMIALKALIPIMVAVKAAAISLTAVLGTLTLGSAAVAMAVAVAAVAIYKTADAWWELHKAANAAAAANKDAETRLGTLHDELMKHQDIITAAKAADKSWIELGALRKLYEEGVVSLRFYQEKLREAGTIVGDAVGTMKELADEVDNATDAIRLMTLEELIAAEVHSRQQAGISALVSTILDWREQLIKLPYVMSPVVSWADEIRFAIERMDAELERSQAALEKFGRVAEQTQEVHWGSTEQGRETLQTMEKIRKQGQKTYGDIGQAAQRMSRQVSHVMTDLSREMANLIFQGGRWKDSLVSVGKALARMAIEAQFRRIGKAVGDLIAKSGALQKVWGTIFGGGAGGGVAGAAQGAAGAGQGAAGGAGGAGGGFPGALVGAAQFGWNIVADKKKVDALWDIEWNTRWTGKWTSEWLQSVLQTWLDPMAVDLSLVKGATQMTQIYGQGIRSTLWEIRDLLTTATPSPGLAYAGAPAGSGSSGQGATIHVHNYIDGRELTNTLFNRGLNEIRIAHGVRN